VKAAYDLAAGKVGLASDETITGRKNFAPSASTDPSDSVTIVRNANYSGGTVGFVYSNLRVTDTVANGTNSFEWPLLSVLNNYGQGENVAVYGQGNAYTNATNTWAGVFEARDRTGGNTSALVGVEVDNFSNGPDTGNKRVGVDIVGARHDLGGANTEIYAGLRISDQLGQANTATFKNGILMGNTAEVTPITTGISMYQTGTTGIDTSSATLTNAIKVGATQKFTDGTVTKTLSELASAGGSLPSQTGNAYKYLRTDGSSTSWQNVGVTTTTPVSTFYVQGVAPGFWLDETNDTTKGMYAVLDAGRFQLQRRATAYGAYEASPYALDITAPSYSLLTNSSGYLGIGIGSDLPASITAPLHVYGDEVNLFSTGTAAGAGTALSFRMAVGGGNANSIIAQIKPKANVTSIGNRLDFYVPAWNDNNNAGSALMTLDQSGNATLTGTLGVGTTSPAYQYEQVTSGGVTTLALTSYGSAPQIIGRAAGGTSSSPSATTSGQTLLQLATYGYETNTPGWLTTTPGYLRMLATENFTNAAHGTRWEFATTATGTTTRSEKMRIGDDGAVGIGTTSCTGAGNVCAAGTVTAANISTSTMLISSTAPTISSGFGTSPSISASNGTAAFRVTVGSGGTAFTGVITLPTAATGWNCTCQDMTVTNSQPNFICKQTASTTTSASFHNYSNTATDGAWSAGDTLLFQCSAL
jgi:hypothetical protein